LPTPFDWYAELKSWQQSLASLLGFGALMVAALFNYHLNRRRDQRLREEEANAVAAALYGEILLIRIEVARAIRALALSHRRRELEGKEGSIDEHFLEAFPLPEPLLYKSLAAKIGMLSPDLILAITEFHSNYQEVRSSIPLLLHKEDRGFSYTPLAVLRPARDAVMKIRPALRRIENLVPVASPAADPNLSEVEDLIDVEEFNRG